MVGGGGKAREHGRTCSGRIIQCGRGGLLSLPHGPFFNHYQGHPDGTVHILRLVLVRLNIELGSRPFLQVIFIHRSDVTQQPK